MGISVLSCWRGARAQDLQVWIDLVSNQNAVVQYGYVLRRGDVHMQI